MVEVERMQVGSKGGVNCNLRYRSCKLVVEGGNNVI